VPPRKKAGHQLPLISDADLKRWFGAAALRGAVEFVTVGLIDPALAGNERKALCQESDAGL